MTTSRRRDDEFSKWNGVVVKKATPFQLVITNGRNLKVGMEITDESGKTFVVSSITSVRSRGSSCIVTGNCRKLKEVAERHGWVYAKEKRLRK